MVARKPSRAKSRSGKRMSKKTVSSYGIFFYVRRYFLGIAVVLVVGLGIFLFKLIGERNVCANSVTCVGDLSGKIENDATGVFAGQVVIPPKIDLSQDNVTRTVLGTETPAGPKRVHVDLTTQTLTAYEGDKQVLSTRVSTGKWGKTPTGEFKVWIKVRAQKMSGGSGADYYYLPNVPFVMFFSNDKVAAARGFSLHGAYWHNNFGHPMSHGCVNMRIVDAEALYHWINPVSDGNVTHSSEDNPGTPITITGTIPVL